MKKRFFIILPLALFAVLVFFLARGLQLDARELPSPLIGRPAPAFDLARLNDPAARFAPADLRGQVWLLNVWASWCAPCREELPALMALADRKLVPIVGLNYKDSREQGQRWLGSFGNPYLLSAHDLKGEVGIDYGVYGVPETFVIDREGVVRLKHTGPLTEAVVRDKLLPLLRELGRG
jgi:cytochrome c biogenesis protein CcmG/thiol:disulfide interchange protein DsbE